MRMSFHGGMCCGIKHIFELNFGGLDDLCDALPEVRKNNSDCSYYWTQQDERVFTDAAPAETKLKRLDRYLEWLKLHRPSGIVEITLVTPTHGSYSQLVWVPVLKERGFREVTPEGGVYNSNSGNYVRVFHLYTKNGVVI